MVWVKTRWHHVVRGSFGYESFFNWSVWNKIDQAGKLSKLICLTFSENEDTIHQFTLRQKIADFIALNYTKQQIPTRSPRYQHHYQGSARAPSELRVEFNTLKGEFSNNCVSKHELQPPIRRHQGARGWAPGTKRTFRCCKSPLPRPGLKFVFREIILIKFVFWTFNSRLTKRHRVHVQR